jgi:hypothetical protein
MNLTTVKNQVILFSVMFCVALLLNPMNILAYDISHLYLSTTLILTSGYMASTMLWSHQLVHYFQMGHFNKKIVTFGILLSLLFIFLLRSQTIVTPNQWLRRMIPHHSTALTTTTRLLNNENVDDKTFRLAKNIILTQQKEIDFMKSLL